MMNTCLLALLLVAGATASRSDRIVGGEETTIEYYPSLVQIEARYFLGLWSQYCAGSILTSRFILSSASCFSGPTYDVRNRRVRAGTTYRNIGGSISYILQEYNHPSFGQLDHDGDISVIRLADALVYSPVIQQALIVPPETIIPDNLPVTFAGWGRTLQAGESSPVLRHVDVRIINNNECRDRFLTLPEPRKVSANMICAGALDEGGKGVCDQDNGGPLYYDSIVIGVVSWSYGCANETFPDVSTAVSSYTDWIIYTVESYT